jgi:hypothetical protein
MWSKQRCSTLCMCMWWSTTYHGHQECEEVVVNLSVADHRLPLMLLTIMVIATLDYLQCTTMGLSPVCCCVLMTWSMRSIMPAPVLGAPLSGHAVKWNCLTTRCLLSVDCRVA